MRYLFAIIFPPVAVLLCGKPITALVNFMLTLLLWIPGVIHAFMVVSSHNADNRMRRHTKAVTAVFSDTAGK